MGMRSLVVNIKGEDFIQYAEARGLRNRRILMKYVFRNAILPQVTSLAMQLGFIFSGSLIVEWIFSYPGIGTLFVNAVRINDFNVMQGCTLIIILAVTSAVFIIDLLYPVLDPRISYEER